MSSILIRRANMVCGGTPPVPVDYDTKYLTFEAQEAGTFSFNLPAAITSSHVTSVSYSIDDGETWTTTNNTDSAITITTPTINSGHKVLWKGIAVRYGTSTSDYCNFSSTGRFLVNGNMMSLLYGDDFINKTSLGSSTYVLNGLFRNCSNLTSAKNLVLKESSVGQRNYNAMFQGCTSLTIAPELPATSVSHYGYYNMFYGCSSLGYAPALPATSVGNYGYSGMFRGCTSLVQAPDLLLATLNRQYCYYQMFYGCSSLNYIKCLATTISGTGATSNWVNGVAASGTFVKDSNMSSWSTGNSGIPSGWTVIDAS